MKKESTIAVIPIRINVELVRQVDVTMIRGLKFENIECQYCQKTSQPYKKLGKLYIKD